MRNIRKYSAIARPLKALFCALAVVLFSASAPAAAMGRLSEYTKAIFDCPGLSIGGWGPSHAAIKTASMEPIDICLYDLKTHRGLKLKIPAAYFEVTYSGENALHAIGLLFWMPGFQPDSAIAPLRDPDPKKRFQYIKDNQRNQVRITLKSTSNLPGYSEDSQKRFRENHRWTERADLGLEHYQDSCESLYTLKSQGRDLSTRKCTKDSFFGIYVGRSEVTLGMTLIQCSRGNEVCMVSSRFEGHSLEFNILPAELPRLKEYEIAIDQFLRKYLVEKLPANSGK